MGRKKDLPEDSGQEFEMRSVSKLVWLSPGMAISVGGQSKPGRFDLAWGFFR